MRKKLLASVLSLTMLCSIWTETTVFAATDSMQTVSPLTKSTYTHADAFNGMNVFNGIDVSYHKGTIDWNAVAASGIDYAIIRVGYRGYGSTGNLCSDVKFTENIEGAINAGIPVGVYYYTEAISEKEAIEEANYCLDKIKKYDISLPVTIDFEPATNKGRSYNANLSKTQATKQVQAFCDTVAAAGYTPAIYANKSDLTTRIDGTTLGKSYNIWLAHYTKQSDYKGAYQQWQYSSSGTISGINGTVDCNFLYSTSDSLNNASSNATSIATAKISSIANQTYTGKTISPAVTVTYNGNTLVKNRDYKLIYANNKAVGKASVTAKGIGTYKGSVTRQFNINPPKITGFKAKTGSRQITLSWKKNASGAGYQIFRKASYNAKTYKKVKTISANQTTSWINKKLAYNREYFYCIRAYKTVNGANFYSDYTYLTGATKPGHKKATVMNKVTLYKKPTLKGTKLATIPKRARVTYVGRTYVSGSKKVYHIKYQKSGKTLNGYISSKTKIYY